MGVFSVDFWPVYDDSDVDVPVSPRDEHSVHSKGGRRGRPCNSAGNEMESERAVDRSVCPAMARGKQVSGKQARCGVRCPVAR